MKEYNFLPGPEAVRGLIIAVVTVLAQVIASTDLSKVTDWHTYALALLAVAGHAASVYIWSALAGTPKTPPSAIWTPGQAQQQRNVKP